MSWFNLIVPIFLSVYSYACSTFLPPEILIDSNQFYNVPTSYFSRCLFFTINYSRSVDSSCDWSSISSYNNDRHLCSSSSCFLSLNFSFERVHWSAQIDIVKFTIKFSPKDSSSFILIGSLSSSVLFFFCIFFIFSSIFCHIVALVNSYVISRNFYIFYFVNL